AVNDELVSLQMVLPDAFDLLREKGRLVVISFHSLEDRIVKKFLSLKEKEEAGKIITKKIVVPSEEEIKRNNRSRSAKMRVIEKI
ncbi:MAG: 16S rRNA (cytosine(1402)-N(4))-methyltransferase, partial [Patescibacteria group bacterium]